MKNKKILILVGILLVVIVVSFFIKNYHDEEVDLTGKNTINEVEEANYLVLDASDYEEDYQDETIINLDSLEITGKGAVIEDKIIKITDSKDYYITGENEVQIVVECGGVVHLILDNTNISYDGSSPIYIKKAEKVIVTLKEGSSNTITDSDSYDVDSDEEPDGAIFSKSDLIINGSGNLVVESNYKDGIASKEGLKIINSNIKVTSNDDGIRGKDYIYFEEVKLDVTSDGDGIKSTNTDSGLGFITIQSGDIKIVSETDGIQAESNLQIKSGTINIETGGGSSNSSTNTGWGMWGSSSSNLDSSSSKALKASQSIVIEDGNIMIDSSDDSIHSNKNIVVTGGSININSGDDGIHADSSLTINGGYISIKKSYEGLEGQNVIINGGEINVVASDDGINSASGSDTTTEARPGANSFDNDTNANIYINGGLVYINATGDGIDSNGSISLTDGTVIVNGPTNDGNGSIDKGGKFKITGGTFVASGSSGMAEMPDDEESTQNSVMIGFDTSISSGSIISIKNSIGDEIITYSASKDYNNLVFSTPDVENGNYTIYINGSTDSSNSYGLYETGNYNGEEYDTFEVSSLFTKIGNGSMMMNPGGGNPGGGNPGRGGRR